ncbi:cytochrome C oxidase subunit IV family protein [Pontibacter sp. G13]|uniref:cytochrome C oxidase subunit IV family protein n=1 Tax=Pontibacter sp. G13 TaxID=3074898 RepID=UPI00288B8C40|nr:cytochrome C oxidase subunit IV family protein [Pontibacter sp. G13]WNJ16610.1 cytochrome C oxidase subunit IV family protein [Pontibacter sp. G13]
MASDGASARKEIYRTALILTALTILEFIIAFTWESIGGAIGISAETAKTMTVLLYFILTIFKAFYIVAVFMHLKNEVKQLMLTILLPFLFIIWLIIGLVIEGDYWGGQSQAEDLAAAHQTEQVLGDLS